MFVQTHKSSIYNKPPQLTMSCIKLVVVKAGQNFFLRNVAKRLVMFHRLSPKNLHKQNSSCIIFLAVLGPREKKSLFKELALFLKIQIV